MTLRYATFPEPVDNRFVDVLAGVTPIAGAYNYTAKGRNIWELHFTRELRAGEAYFVKEVIEEQYGGTLLSGPVELPELPGILY